MNILFSEAKHVVIKGSYGSGKSILGLKKLELIWKSEMKKLFISTLIAGVICIV